MAKKQEKIYPLVKITWSDAWGHSSWMEINEAVGQHSKGEQCVSVGYLLSDTAEGYLLASTISSRDVNGLFFVPRAMAKAIERPKGARKRG